MSFEEIHDHYAFFLAHSDQEEKLSLAVAARVAAHRPRRVLDFGCGRGTFLEKVLAGLPVELTLVEPDPAFLAEAAARLAPSQAWPRLQPWEGDLVLCTHVLYYVDDLSGTLAALLEGLEPGGRLLVVLAAPEKVTTRLREHCCRLQGRPFPYRTAEELAATGYPWTQTVVHSTLACEDTRENREHIVRFLMPEEEPCEEALEFFTQFRQGTRLVCPNQDVLFELTKPL